MRRGPIEIHLPETRDLVGGFSRRQKPERSVAFDFFFECKFRPRHQQEK